MFTWLSLRDIILRVSKFMMNFHLSSRNKLEEKVHPIDVLFRATSLSLSNHLSAKMGVWSLLFLTVHP